MMYNLVGSCVRLLTAIATLPLWSGCAMQAVTVASTPMVRMAKSTRGFPIEQEATRSRSLADEGCSDENGALFVSSSITNLGHPIGGCYKRSVTRLLHGFPFYGLGGGVATNGQAWIYASVEGNYEIGMVEEVDEPNGTVTALETVCSAIDFQAVELTGPTDTKLDGAWECAYFQDGVTNYADADFTRVECGCSGRSIGSSSGLSSSTAVAITVLVAVAVLVVLVCGCLIHVIKIRKSQIREKALRTAPKQSNDSSAPEQDAAPTAPEQGTASTFPEQGNAPAAPEQDTAPTAPEQDTTSAVPEQDTVPTAPTQYTASTVAPTEDIATSSAV